MPYLKLSEYCAKKIYDPNWPIQKILPNIPLNITDKMVIKVDQFVKRRGKNGLVKTNITNIDQVAIFVNEHPNFNSFIIEKQFNIREEKYFCIKIVNGKKQYIFNCTGGININDPYENAIITSNLHGFGQPLKDVLLKLDMMFDDIYANSLEVNPLILAEDYKYYPIDFAVEIDECALPFLNSQYLSLINECENSYSNYEVEKEIKNLDEQSGASLKFKILNPNGRIMTLIAGGGASVLFTDAIVNRGYGSELYNYGEYSGNPSEDEVMRYCSLIFENWLSSLVENKVLFIGGGISNFTDVAKTFKGIIAAIKKFDFSGVSIWVRRGGVNEKKALKMLKEQLSNLNIQIRGTESPITEIVMEALPQIKIPEIINEEIDYFPKYEPKLINLWNQKIMFVGNHSQIIQRIIDYDYYIGKETTDVICIYEQHLRKDKVQSFYWGNKRINIPITSNPNLGNYTVTVFNYASVRSVESITKKLMVYDNIKTFYIIAEGLPERNTLELYECLKGKGKTLLGPSSVGAIKSGISGQRIGSVGGLMDNIKRCNLATQGNVAIITKSGGLLNEMVNFVSNLGLSIAEAVSIGGDRYPGIRFADLLQYYSMQPHIQLVIMIGETGGIGEIEGNCRKPVISWCSGTSEKCFSEVVEFGHAGASATNKYEEASVKNQIMRLKGYLVPETFEKIGDLIIKAKNLLKITECQISDSLREVPLDLSDAINNGIVRLTPNFRTNICDERNDLKYRGESIENIITKNYSLGYTIGSLWLNLKLNDWACFFIEKILVLLADHGPAVSGAQNTIITSRAGKNITESLAAGILTIGPKFGGAISGAAIDFFESYLRNETAVSFVERMKNEGKIIMGIGHKIKSKFNPDKRVELIKEIIRNFPSSPIFNYALEIEKETLKKKANLILNVDGAIGAALVDLLLNYKTIDETKIIINNDLFNGFFILARSIGLIAHYQEQKSQENGLYRANSWDVEYI